MSKTIEYDGMVMETKDGGTRYTFFKIHNTFGTLSLYLNKKDDTAYISDFYVTETIEEKESEHYSSRRHSSYVTVKRKKQNCM